MPRTLHAWAWPPAVGGGWPGSRRIRGQRSLPTTWRAVGWGPPAKAGRWSWWTGARRWHWWGRRRFRPPTAGGAVPTSRMPWPLPSSVTRRGSPWRTSGKGCWTFQASHFLCPGRLNMASVRDFRVLMDYAHNIAAFEEMARLVASLPRARTIGVVAGPGDRQDSVLRRLGEIAGATFDLLVIKEDDDLRGRKPGESAAIIEQGARQARFARCRGRHHTRGAVRGGVRGSRPGAGAQG